MDACFTLLGLTPRKVTDPITFFKDKTIKKYDTTSDSFIYCL